MPYYKMNGRKDGKQKYRVRVNFVDEYGISKQIDRVIYGLDEAKQFERELIFRTKVEVPAKKYNLSELMTEYIYSKKNEIRETSLDKMIFILNTYVLKYLGTYRLDRISVSVLQKWKNNIESLDLKIRTRQNIYGEFRALLNYAVKMEYLPNNPLLKIGNFKAPLEQKTEMLFYTPEEFGKYILAARKFAEESNVVIEWGYYVFFAIAYYTGMRKGEIGALKWTDITENIISVTKSVTQKLKGEDRITGPKNKSSIRKMQLPQPLIEILDEHYERCKHYDGFSDNYLICGGTRALRDSSVQNHNDKFAELAGVKKIRIHDFRHSHASLLANEGINIQEIARRLGHAQISMTLETYSHLYPREEERAITVLDKIRF